MKKKKKKIPRCPECNEKIFGINPYGVGKVTVRCPWCGKPVSV